MSGAAGPGTDGGRGSQSGRRELLAGAASEADVVALRDWTKHVTEAHDGRLRRIEQGLHLVADSRPGVRAGGGGHVAVHVPAVETIAGIPG